MHIGGSEVPESEARDMRIVNIEKGIGKKSGGNRQEHLCALTNAIYCSWEN